MPTSTFRPGVVVDDDLRFAAHCVAVWGPQAPRWRVEQKMHQEKVAMALAEISQLIQDHLHPSVAKAAEKKRPAHMAFLTAVMR